MHSAVRQMRRAFAARDAPDVIVTSGSGYRINVDDGQLDAQRFDRLVADADTFLTSPQEHPGFRQAGTAWRLRQVWPDAASPDRPRPGEPRAPRERAVVRSADRGNIEDNGGRVARLHRGSPRTAR
jgi:hypothetical protein